MARPADPPADPPAATPALAPLPDAPSGISGWMLVDLDTGAVIDARNADHAFAPASVSKLPTSFYAFDRLGPEHRFVTRLLATGPVVGGVLRGDLVLVGGGDPELDTDALDPLVKALANAGIRRVAGRLVVDGSAALAVPAIDPTQPVDAAYNPALSGLCLNFNRVRLRWSTRGDATSMRVSALGLRQDPVVQGVRVTLASAPNAPLFSHDVEDGAEVWHIRASDMHGKGARWLPLRRPGLYAGEVFATLAGNAGIDIGDVVKGRAPEGARQIAQIESHDLRRIVRSMLRYSTNLTAEMIGQAATRADGGHPRSLADSAAAMDAWAAQAAGFAVGDPGFRFVNHSGLSDDTRVSPRRLVQLMVAMAKRQTDTGVRFPHLPGGVIDLLDRYNVAARSVHYDFRNVEIAAKTGTMDYVSGLAGFIALPSGRRLAFAVFSNDLGRRHPDTRRINRGWMARARGLERALVRHWVMSLNG